MTGLYNVYLAYREPLNFQVSIKYKLCMGFETVWAPRTYVLAMATSS